LTVLSSTPWFEAARLAAPEAHRLFCLPYAGGSASTYRNWGLPDLPGIAVCPVLLPGRERRIEDPPHRSLGTLVDQLCDDLPTERPFALFGHSMGALLAFELARSLRRYSLPPPTHLIVSGAPAPDFVPNRPPRFRLDRADLVAELVKLGGTPAEVLQNDELLDLCLPAVRADFAMLDTYRYTHEEPLDLPLTVLYGAQDTEVDEDEVFAWRRHVSKAARFVRFGGGHFFLDSEGTAVRAAVADTLRTPD